MFRELISSALRQLTDETTTAEKMARGCRLAGHRAEAQRRSSQAAGYARRHARMLEWAMSRDRQKHSRAVEAGRLAGQAAQLGIEAVRLMRRGRVEESLKLTRERESMLERAKQLLEPVPATIHIFAKP